MANATINFANPEEVKTYLIHTTKTLRVGIDQVLKSVEGINNTIIKKGSLQGREEYITAAKRLKEAKMWLGVALGEFGSELPEEFKDEFKPKGK